jgi:hypothetical protein
MPARREDYEEAERQRALADLAELRHEGSAFPHNLEAADARDAVLMGRETDPTTRAVRRMINFVGLALVVALFSYIVVGLARVYL